MFNEGQEQPRDYTPPIELVMVQRYQKDVKCKETGKVLHKAGEPTGRYLKKEGTGAEVAQFWNNNKYVPPRKKRRPSSNSKRGKKQKEKLPTGQEAVDLMNKVNQEAENRASNE